MGFIYCPNCEKKVSDIAVLTACPECYHPFNAKKWLNITKKQQKELKDKLEKEKEIEKIRVEKIIEERKKRKEKEIFEIEEYKKYYIRPNLVKVIDIIENRNNLKSFSSGIFYYHETTPPPVWTIDKTEICDYCGGDGKIKDDGSFFKKVNCHYCNGRGIHEITYRNTRDIWNKKWEKWDRKHRKSISGLIFNENGSLLLCANKIYNMENYNEEREIEIIDYGHQLIGYKNGYIYYCYKKNKSSGYTDGGLICSSHDGETIEIKSIGDEYGYFQLEDYYETYVEGEGEYRYDKQKSKMNDIILKYSSKYKDNKNNYNKYEFDYSGIGFIFIKDKGTENVIFEILTNNYSKIIDFDYSPSGKHFAASFENGYLNIWKWG